VHRSRIDRLDVLARSIFSSSAIFKREALQSYLSGKKPLYYHIIWWKTQS